MGDFEELDRFSRQKKSPIGYEVRVAVYALVILSVFVFKPFAEMCIQYRNRKEASKYIPKCAIENRFQLYIKIE